MEFVKLDVLTKKLWSVLAVLLCMQPWRSSDKLCFGSTGINKWLKIIDAFVKCLSIYISNSNLYCRHVSARVCVRVEGELW